MTTRRAKVSRLRPPPSDKEEILAAIAKVDRTVIDFQKSTSGTLERLLPMTEAVGEAVRALSQKVEKVEADLDAVRRRVLALEQVHHPKGTDAPEGA